jgi:hypothetical protein
LVNVDLGVFAFARADLAELLNQLVLLYLGPG